ncbi:MAG: L,D-transpeptidase family protein [Bacillota bacterium]
MNRFSVFIALLLVITCVFTLYIAKSMNTELEEYISWEIQCMDEYYESQELTMYLDVPAAKLYLFMADEMIKDYPVAAEIQDNAPSAGVWRVISKSTYALSGSKSMSLNVPWGSFCIIGSRKDSVNPFGSFVKMRISDINELFPKIRYGTRVEIYNGPLGPFGSRLRTIKPGDKGADVMEVQKLLRQRGYFSGSCDGVYDLAMEAAVESFQKDSGIKQDKIIGSRMYQLLGIIPFE